MKISAEQYQQICDVIDAVKLDDHTKDTDEYALSILRKLGLDPDTSSFPEGYDPSNMMGNVVDVLSDRSGMYEHDVAHWLADTLGEGDYFVAEDACWNFIGPALDRIMDEAGIQWGDD